LTGFQTILDAALGHHDAEVLDARMPVVLSAQALSRVGDDRVLAAMAQRIFSAGFRWRVVQMKWPDIEAAFDGFGPSMVAAYDAHRVDALRNDRRVIRHPGKIKAIVSNANRLVELSADQGGVARWIASWPDGDVVGLWHALAKRFTMMGGVSAPRFLRLLGKDTFILTPDVLAALASHDVYVGKGTGKRDQRAIQAVFNTWRGETGRPLAHLSVLLAASIGP